MKKASIFIIIGLFVIALIFGLRGCENKDVLSLAKIQKMYDKVELGMTSGDVISALGEPDQIKTGKKGGLSSYNYLDGALIVDIRNGMVASKQIYYSSNIEKNIMVGSETKTELKDLDEVISKVEEGMKLNKVEKILGDKYIQTLNDWYYEYTSYTWYDQKENHVEIEFDKKGRVDYINDIIHFSGEKNL